MPNKTITIRTVNDFPRVAWLRKKGATAEYLVVARQNHQQAIALAFDNRVLSTELSTMASMSRYEHVNLELIDANNEVFDVVFDLPPETTP